MTKIITIANRKGGAGKSTCAAHFAVECVKKGLKTLLIDLDPQGTLEQWWSKREDENPYLSSIDGSEIESMIENTKKHNFDICIIDTPGDMSENAMNGIKVADFVVIPSKPTAPDLGAIGRTIHVLEKYKKKYAFVITQAIPRTNGAFEAAAILSKYGEVASASLFTRTAYAKAMQAGISAAEIDDAAKFELEKVWSFLENKLYKEQGFENEKTKIQLI